ncbi:reverse transcriptase-like protein [Clostridium butyricum]|uniref:reverse transcriptase-like protein n=1 Tax=Clostridium butyricum TaxID=1492 RepID=UPI00325BC4DE
MSKWICKCDASNNEAIGMTIGIQIMNTTTSKEFLFSEGIGPFGNSNFAEGQAIIKSLLKLAELCKKDDIITIYGDNQDVIGKVNKIIIRGMKKTKRKPPEYVLNIINLMSNFENIELKWIPRNLNRKAHYLSREPFLDKYTEYRAKKINVKYINDNIFLAQSSKDKKIYYTVDLELCTCTCRFFKLQHWWERKKCKHIIAAENYTNNL